MPPKVESGVKGLVPILFERPLVVRYGKEITTPKVLW
jgi:hypothetical protein